MNSNYHLIGRQPSSSELRNIFAASCIESLAARLGCPASAIYRRMKRVGLIDNYIYPFYEALHTESREHVTEDVLQCLLRWEANICIS